MWPNREGAAEEPAWVKAERKQFVEYRDKNKDGKLDKAEVKEWLLPDDFDHATAEAHHLALEADKDKVCVCVCLCVCVCVWYLSPSLSLSLCECACMCARMCLYVCITCKGSCISVWLDAP